MVSWALRWVWSLGLVLAALLHSGRARADAENYSLGVESYRELTLANGLHVVIAVDRRVPRVALHVAYAVGDALDPPERHGLARLIGKALPWLATRHLANDERQRLWYAAGFRFDPPAVQVTADATELNLEVPAEALDLALWVEADRMGFAADGLTQSTLRWSIDEAKKDLSKNADDIGTATAYFATLGPEHPYGAYLRAVHIDDVTAELFAARLRRYYNPANAALVVVGDLDVASAEQSITRLFGSLAAAPVPRAAAATGTSAVRTIMLEASTTKRVVAEVWSTSAWFSSDDLGLDVVAALLRRRAQARELCETSYFRQASRFLASVFVALCDRPKQSPAAWKAWVETELAVLREGRASAADVAGAVLEMQRNYATRYDAPRERAEAIAMSVLGGHGAKIVEERLATLASFDVASLAGVVRRNLTNAMQASVEIVATPGAPREGRLAPNSSARSYRAPVANGELAATDSELFSRPPAVGTVPRFQPPLGLTELLANGDELRFLPAPSSWVANADVYLPFRGGPNELAAKALLGALLETRVANDAPLGGALRSLGANVRVTADATSLHVDVNAPAKQLSAAVDALGRDLFGDEISADSLAAAKREVEKNFIERARGEWELAENALGLSAPKSAYRYQTKSARRAALAGVTLPKLKQLLRETLAQSADLNIAGPFDASGARTLAAALSKRRPGKHASAKRPKVAFRAGVYVLDGGSADAIEVAILWQVPAWGSQGHLPVHVLPWYFGSTVSDGFDARLAEHQAREPSWQSNTLLTHDADFLRYSFRAPLDQLVPVLESVKAQLGRLGEGHFEATDLARILEGESQFQMQLFASSEGLGRVLHWASSHDRDTSEASDVANQLKRVTPAEFAAAAKGLSLGRAVLALRGPADKLKEPLAKLGLAPASVTADETEPVKP